MTLSNSCIDIILCVQSYLSRVMYVSLFLSRVLSGWLTPPRERNAAIKKKIIEIWQLISRSTYLIVTLSRLDLRLSFRLTDQFETDRLWINHAQNWWYVFIVAVQYEILSAEPPSPFDEEFHYESFYTES